MKVTYTDAQGAAQLLAQNPDMKIIDVRTLAEFKSGHIDGAIRNGFIGFGFKNRLQVFDKDKEYLIACRTGHRSIPALKSFSKLGFTHIIHLDGGMQAWKKADLPVTK